MALRGVGYSIVPAVVPEHLRLPAWGTPSWAHEADTWVNKATKQDNQGDARRPMWDLSVRGKEVVAAVLEATSRWHGLRTGEQACMSFPEAGLKALATDEGAGEQKLHYDYDWATCEGTELYHRSALWGAHTEFEISAKVGGRDCPTVRIAVEPQHVLYFRSDFYHGGGNHVADMARFHGYEVPSGEHPPYDSVYY